MTENEAIEVLKDFGKQVSVKADGAYQSTIGEKACDIAIKALKEIQKYRKIEKDLKENYHANVDIPLLMKHFIETVFKGEKHEGFCILTNEDKEAWEEYKAIGTPEECRKSVEICKSMIERNITPEDMEEYMKFEDECISEGFTLKSLLEAGEKQKAKRPDYEGDGYSDGHLVYDTWICPCCGKHYEVDYDDYDFCPACGQCIDWSDEE